MKAKDIFCGVMLTAGIVSTIFCVLVGALVAIFADALLILNFHNRKTKN